MSKTVEVLDVVRVLNGVLALGVNSITTAQRLGAVLEQALAEGRPISKDELRTIAAEADVADARLAASLRRLGGE